MKPFYPIFMFRHFFATPKPWLIYFLLLSPAIYAEEPVSKRLFDSVAIDGHDTVAYHQTNTVSQHVSTRGKDDFTVEWKGAEWRFASQKSRDAFAADPTRFSPAYNGHCANALSLGEGLIRTDGTHWEIFDNQLYLFYASRGRDRWLGGKDYHVYKAVADEAWKEILQIHPTQSTSAMVVNDHFE